VGNTTIDASGNILAKGLQVGNTTIDASGTILAKGVQVGNTTIDASGNISAKAITVGEGITSNDDIVANNANLHVNGDQVSTGILNAAYVALPDFNNAQYETNLWANNNELYWQDISSNTLNISNAVRKQAVGTTIPLATDPESCIVAINALLSYFAGKALFLTTSGDPSLPLPLEDPPTPNMDFNGPFTINFSFSSIYPEENSVVPSFTFDYSNDNLPLSSLCQNINDSIQNGFSFSDYCTLHYSPQNIQVTITPMSGYAVTINDVNYVGEAVRFCNSIGITNIIAGRKFSLPAVGSELVVTNPQPLYNSPDVAVGVPGQTSVVLTLFPPTLISPLTPPPVVPNPVKYYSIYASDTEGLTNLVAVLDASTDPINYTFTYPPTTVHTVIFLYVYSIDTYNQSFPCEIVYFSPSLTDT
jgi:hypothetical protein